MDTITVMSSEVGGAVREAWFTELWCLIEHSIRRGKIYGQPTRKFQLLKRNQRWMRRRWKTAPPVKNHSTLPRLQARTSFLTRTQLTKRNTQSSGRKSLQTVQQIYKRQSSSAEPSGVQVALLLGPTWPRRPYLLEGVCGEERCCMSVQKFCVTIPCVVKNYTLFRNQRPLPDHQCQYFCQDNNHFTCLLVSWYEESKVTRQQLKF